MTMLTQVSDRGGDHSLKISNSAISGLNRAKLIRSLILINIKSNFGHHNITIKSSHFDSR